MCILAAHTHTCTHTHVHTHTHTPSLSLSLTQSLPLVPGTVMHKHQNVIYVDMHRERWSVDEAHLTIIFFIFTHIAT